MQNSKTAALAFLKTQLEGELHYDQTMRILYATDASAFRELPLAVAFPKNVKDLQKLITFARQNQTSLIPRTAGTSLAGQVVGAGIVVDVSRHFNQILEFNEQERWVKVQPGVVRDELNIYLKPYGLFYAPETSTANRAMIGGMIGNNSCGSNSVVYGSAREHLLEVNALLADGTETHFKALESHEYLEKLTGKTTSGDLEKNIYRETERLLNQEIVKEEIRKEFPKKSIPRRNTGYAIDMLVDNQPFNEAGEAFNFCKLIAGSEGTLCILTEIKLNLLPLPPKNNGLICIHTHTIDEALRANLIALKYQPYACELIDSYILECTKNNTEQQKNRFFVQGDPGAILVVELAHENREQVETEAAKMIDELQSLELGYHFPLLFGEDCKKIWTLRKAGLGLLSNMPGDAKPVPVIEDTAVDVQELPAYIKEFNEILAKHGMYSVHYAHAGSGELHLRPIINLKTKEGHQQFRIIAEEIADLVKKYNGSLSGEHGDGRLRGEFIPKMIGRRNYEYLKQIKNTWDPYHIFNPGKITETPPMDAALRYAPNQQVKELKTYFDFGKISLLQHAEQCNGSGDCRKTHLSGGTMCPSYMATRNEKDTTRARANILREMLTQSKKANPFDHEEIKEVMDLCLSCKGCKSECPSNVDVGKLKAEFLQQYYDANGVPLRSWLIGNYALISRLATPIAPLYNLAFSLPGVSSLLKNLSGFHPKRSIPPIRFTSLKSWFKNRKQSDSKPGKTVFFFCDEFTNHQDVEIGKKAILLLEKLGYQVIIPNHNESGRAFLSKGMLKEAKEIALQNVLLLKDLISENQPIVGVEPSAILSFRDEYPDLVGADLKNEAIQLGKNALMLEEFICKEAKAGNIKAEQFTNKSEEIKLHGHCHQKALTGMEASIQMLKIPANYKVEVIPSGCCGMAGSFGYEKEHYEVSMKIGSLVLFPAVEKSKPGTIIAAPGTSCRHQIKDGTGKLSKHPIEILFEALV